MKKWIIILFLLLASCGSKTNENKEQLELKTYKVSTESGQALIGSLSKLLDFGLGEGKKGKVELIANNQLVVVAPQSMQKDIQTLIEEVNEKFKSTQLKSIEAQVYLVEGSAHELKDKKVPSSEVLEALKASEANHPHYSIIDELLIQSSDGSFSRSRSDSLEGKTQFVISGDKINVDMDFSSHIENFSTQSKMTILPNQYFVLWAAQFNQKKRNNKTGEYEKIAKSFFLVLKAKVKE